MGIKRGVYYICDRCGKSTFREETEITSLICDGEIIKDDTFEVIEGWGYIFPSHKAIKGRLLCPDCGKAYDQLMENFMKGTYAIWEN